jgi:hypothetical protein
MADIPIVIILALFVIGAVIAFKIIKSVVKALSLVFLVAVILIAAVSFFVYKDVADFRQNWQDSDKLILLESDGTIEAAIQTALAGDEPVLMKDDVLGIIKTAYATGELEKIKGDNYKIIIMRLEPMLAEIESEKILLGNSKDSISKADAAGIIKSDNALLEIGKISAEQGKSIEPEKNSDSSQAKSAVFALLIKQLAEEKGSKFGVYLLRGYKADNIIIYPETALFRLIKFLPDFIIDKISGISQKEGDDNGNIG